ERPGARRFARERRGAGRGRGDEPGRTEIPGRVLPPQDSGPDRGSGDVGSSPDWPHRRRTGWPRHACGAGAAASAPEERLDAGDSERNPTALARGPASTTRSGPPFLTPEAVLHSPVAAPTQEDVDVTKRAGCDGGAAETTTRTRAALGFRAHSGWAVVVAIAGSPRSPRVVDRRRVELADPDKQASKQPYHAAEGLDLKKAEELVRRATEDAQRLARQGLRAVIDDLHAGGHQVIGCGIVLASGRPATTLAATLASHALIHTAEGELFRNVLVRSGEHHDLP